MVQRLAVLPPGGRETIYANSVLGNIGGMAAYLSGTVPFVAERSIYWGDGRVEGTNTMGETSVARRWDLPRAWPGQLRHLPAARQPVRQRRHGRPQHPDRGLRQVTLPPSMRKVVPAMAA